MPTSPFHYLEYRCQDETLLMRFIDAFSLALMTRISAEHVVAAHIPLFRRQDNTLFGHIDRQNPILGDGAKFEAHIVFMGPSAYIPPEAYINKQLPTWNYVAVHMTALVEPIFSGEENFAVLRQTSQYLCRKPGNFIANSSDPRVVRNLPGICGIRIVPSQIEGRFKLSQDKAPEDREAAMAWLLNKSRSDEGELLQSLMNY